MIYVLVMTDAWVADGMPPTDMPTEEAPSFGAAAKRFAERGYTGLATILEVTNGRRVEHWQLASTTLYYARPAT